MSEDKNPWGFCETPEAKCTMKNMKLKAKYKWNGEEVKVKPVYFSWHVGLQYKTLTGYSAASIFCNKESEYVFPLQTKIIL